MMNTFVTNWRQITRSAQKNARLLTSNVNRKLKTARKYQQHRCVRFIANQLCVCYCCQQVNFVYIPAHTYTQEYIFIH